MSSNSAYLMQTCNRVNNLVEGKEYLGGKAEGAVFQIFEESLWAANEHVHVTVDTDDVAPRRNIDYTANSRRHFPGRPWQLLTSRWENCLYIRLQFRSSGTSARRSRWEDSNCRCIISLSEVEAEWISSYWWNLHETNFLLIHYSIY